MADGATNDRHDEGFRSRFARFFTGATAARAVSTNGNGHSDHKAATVATIGADHRFIASKSDLLPKLRGLDVADFSDFIPLDGNGHTIPTAAIGATGLAFAAYWYVATRWRAQKIAEAPLMVVAENQTDGSEEWLPNHELAPVLDDPSPDYDMGELIERTSRYLDDGGECLWVKDRDRGKRVARLTPFKKGEFTVGAANGRLFGAFVVETALGSKPFAPEDVCYFRDATDGWSRGRSRLDIAMNWLQLGETARRTVRDLLTNSVWPSLLYVADKDWNPTDDDFKRLQQELNAYGRDGNKGLAQALLGGGSAQLLAARIRDLVPEEVLNRVESVVAAVSGVPAIVLQFQIGMENSPWSQMAEARRMAYDDTIQPMWRKIERVLSRQLLKPDDEDRTHFIRFDRTNIASLQIDRVQATTIATAMGKAATLNERRVIMGLEPASPEQDPDGRADEIPELAPPPPPPPNPLAPNQDPNNPTATDGTGMTKARQRGVLWLGTALKQEARGRWESQASVLLRHDAAEIERILRATSGSKSVHAKAAPDFLARAMAGVIAYLRVSQQKWETVVAQLFTQGAERSVAIAAADLGISYPSLQAHVVSFAKRHAGDLVTDISDTTRKAVENAIVRGLADEQPVEEIARRVAQSGAFTPSRAKLIAQTESTRAAEGGPTEALTAFAKATGRQFTKRWSGELDERERDAHIALEGETRSIDQPFSNGLQFPSEPNCRCALVLSEVVDE